MVIYTNNKISAQIYFQSKRPHTITKMNDNKNMDNNRVSEWLQLTDYYNNRVSEWLQLTDYYNNRDSEWSYLTDYYNNRDSEWSYLTDYYNNRVSEWSQLTDYQFRRQNMLVKDRYFQKKIYLTDIFNIQY